MPGKYEIIYLPIAYDDLDDIVEYILKDNPAAALDTLEKIQNAMERLRSFPKMGSIPRDIRLERMGNRMLIVDDYLIFYVIEGNTIRIRRILYGSRNYSYLL